MDRLQSMNTKACFVKYSENLQKFYNIFTFEAHRNSADPTGTEKPGLCQSAAGCSEIGGCCTVKGVPRDSNRFLDSRQKY